MSGYEKIKKTLGKTSDGARPTNLDLYSRVKAEAKRKFDDWPSAYASSWLVKEYKSRGGKYKKWV
jgi:hypothetical protein